MNRPRFASGRGISFLFIIGAVFASALSGGTVASQEKPPQEIPGAMDSSIPVNIPVSPIEKAQKEGIAYEDLENNKQKVETAKVARQLAEIQLDAETKRFKAGMSQNFLMLQRQRDLSAAQGTELQALVSYKKSIITLEQNMYTLLRSSDFEIAGSVPSAAGQ